MKDSRIRLGVQPCNASAQEAKAGVWGQCGRWGKTLFVAGIVGYVVGERPSVGKERAKALADPRL